MWAGPLVFSSTTTKDMWIIPSFRIWGYVLHVDPISCVITNYGQHQWVIPSHLSIALEALLEENTTRKLLSLSLDLFFKILLFQVAFLIFFSIAIFYPYCLLVGYCSMWPYFSPGNQLRISVVGNWCRIAVSHDKFTSGCVWFHPISMQ